MCIWDLWEVLVDQSCGPMKRQKKEDRGYLQLRVSALFWNVTSSGDFFVVVLSLFDLYQKALWAENNHLESLWSTYIKLNFYPLRTLVPPEKTWGPLWWPTLTILSENTDLAPTAPCSAGTEVWWLQMCYTGLTAPRSLEQHETCSETFQDRAGQLPCGPHWLFVLHELSGESQTQLSDSQVTVQER